MMAINPADAHAYLAAIIASSDDAIISKNLNGIITSWNAAAERIFGYTSEEAVGKHITLLIPQDRLSEEEIILSKLKAGERIEHFETIRRRKDGHELPLSITVSPIRDASGTVIGASKVARDISERIRAEAALQELSRKKDEFLANMSHELRTPMNAVIGLTSLLKQSDTLSDRDRKFVDTLQISAGNLMELINDLLDFAKIESGAVVMEEIEFCLAEQLENAVSLSNIKAQEKRLNLYVDYAPSLNRYYIGDPLRIHQILMNLLSNALKFTESGWIRVELDTASISGNITTVSMRVSDSGIGILPEKLDYIFDKFTQADSSITRRYGGTGLGLAICKALVEKMNGSIAVTSEVGIGTTFTVTLPLKHTDRPSAIESFSAKAAPTARHEHKNILLVEDYEPNILVAGAMLEHDGYSYDVAGNGVDAVRKFLSNRYDLILMDVQMHELDGLEASRRIRRIEAEKNLPRTPIIALTAHVRDQDKEKCREAGMDDFIPKPFSMQDLSQKIRAHTTQQKPTPARRLQG